MVNVQEIIDLITAREINQKEKLIIKAYNFAERAHEGQKRMSGEPYFNHAFETAKILASLGMDAETIASGLLHDVLENTKTTEKELEEEFGPEILFLVNGVTKLGILKYRGHERYVENLRKFFIAMAEDLRVVIIKFADRLHNLKTLQFIPENKRKRIALESIEVYAPLANRLGMGKLKAEIEDAAFPYVYPKEFTQMEEIMKTKIENTSIPSFVEIFYERNIAKTTEELKKELQKNKINSFVINYRVKHKYSLYKKLLKYDMDINKIHDIVALRVIVDSIEECYKVLGIIHSIWNPLPGRIKDYIALPKPNGYQSIHTTIFTGLGGIAEIQIRTKEMHVKADYGIVAHFAYKEQRDQENNTVKLKFKWIEELKGLNYTPDDPKTFTENLKMDFFNDRIFVFTPEGDVIDLPKDSSPIDFAYSIHSDIGNHIFGVKINGKMSQIFSKLKNKDIVEIIQKKDAHPSSKWLGYARTIIAKRHIRSYLEKNSLFSKLKSFGRS